MISRTPCAQLGALARRRVSAFGAARDEAHDAVMFVCRRWSSGEPQERSGPAQRSTEKPAGAGGEESNPFEVPRPTWQQMFIAPLGSPIFVVCLLLLGPVLYFGNRADKRLEEENVRLREQRLSRRRARSDTDSEE
mmetsp:Transcript_91086/g.254512  ORF Transcript_91086/g.254512 Transcript_91086/m.254512 type:complete len:136 (+) Transcript_91086:66-473(+)|eukprot:CAMPEP_0176245378 /NCGR_PEP_ID=MMETSP0121_2-20121125/31912_1 /TAXON_ID=160619 /ORGANISM="Kryptoperidinium foliaceum, Strain CCMP 1326" /LENGTH=135 /DNA_ID=CAMNT_0017585007 /DNA_START=60 /DNA_END=467 /DNA_ORIENTATION=-